MLINAYDPYIPKRRMTMNINPADPVQVLAKVLIDATDKHGALQTELTHHANEVADSVLNAILDKNERGAELRAALGVEVTRTTRMGKNLRAAMDAYTPDPSSASASPADSR